jgi:hypothetical protein
VSKADVAKSLLTRFLCELSGDFFVVKCSTQNIVQLRKFNIAAKVGYNDFHNLMGFTSKKMPNNVLKKCLLKKFFNWLSHILRISILLVQNF